MRNIIKHKNSLLILVNGALDGVGAKTTHGIIRKYSDTHKICIITAQAQDVCTYSGKLIGINVDIPVRASVAEAIEDFGNFDCAIIGVAPHGGKMPGDIHNMCMQALSNGMDVVNVLHDLLENDPLAREMASKTGSVIHEVRKPRLAKDLQHWSGEIESLDTPVLAVLGTDCNVGKRTTATLLESELNREGVGTVFISTGQTGSLIGNGYGFVLDATLNDFVSGEIERSLLICDDECKPDLMIIGGQSSLLNPSGPAGFEILLSSKSKYVVLQHMPSRKYFEGCNSRDTIDIQREKKIIEMLGAEVICVTLNTVGMTKEQVLSERERLSELLQCPVCLPLSEIDEVAEIVMNAIPVLSDTHKYLCATT